MTHEPAWAEYLAAHSTVYPQGTMFRLLLKHKGYWLCGGFYRTEAEAKAAAEDSILVDDYRNYLQEAAVR